VTGVRRRLLIGLGILLAAWSAYGVTVRARRAPRPPSPAGEVRGAWHVHTTRSDGRGTLDEVVRAAREAGLGFVVVSDHNILSPGDVGYRDGVLVIEATEASTRYGHVVAVNVPRALTAAEREGDPLGAIAALGGQAVIAHPFHPERPFTGWGTGPWRGLEVISNDTAWYEVLARREAGAAALAALAFPFDPPRAVIVLTGWPAAELARYDAERGAAGGEGKVLLCSADAHGYPSYRAAFEAFSMHVPVALTGDATRDAREVLAALLDGRAFCVFDGEAPASAVWLARGAKGLELSLSLDGGAATGAAFTLVRDGAALGSVGAGALAPGRNVLTLDGPCGPAGCGSGSYRVEGRWDGRPWLFTNPVRIE
jgi:hypothetical protein